MRSRDSVFRLIFTVLALALLALPYPLTAGTTGKIAGYIRDQATGEPLPVVNVVVEGTLLGAMTNAKGYFVILSVPPGTYSLTARMMGYRQVTVENVRVVVDMTATVDFALQETVLELGEEIVVTAERPLIEKDLTASRSLYTRETIEALPAVSIGQALSITPGYVSGSFRGGRQGRREEVYLVDGIPLVNPIGAQSGRDNTTGAGGVGRIGTDTPNNMALATELPDLGIEQMDIITGGFNAEYGNVQSAVINIVTKEGGSQYRGELRAEVDPAVIGWKIAPPWPIYHFQVGDSLYTKGLHQGYNKDEIYRFSVGGPVPVLQQTLPGDISFHVSGHYIHNTTPQGKWDLWGNKVKGFDTESTPTNWGHSINGKLTYRPSSQFKITLSALQQRRRYYPYSPYVVSTGDTIRVEEAAAYDRSTDQVEHLASTVVIDSLYTMGQADADGNLIPGTSRGIAATNFSLSNLGGQRKASSNLLAATLTHTLSPRTFYELYIGRFVTRNEQWANDPVTGARLYYDDDGVLGLDAPRFHRNQQNILGFVSVNPMNASRFGDFENQVTWTVKGDFTSQITEGHQPKAGFDFKYYDLQLYRFGIASGGNDYNDGYKRKPWYVAVYAQDKMEFEGMIVNVGMRLDAIAPRSYYPGNYLDPLSDDYSSSNLYAPDYFVENDPATKHPVGKSDPEAYKTNLKDPKKTGVDFDISPRLGISFPVTEDDVLHFSYGHYFQQPTFDSYLTNTGYDLRGAFKYIGNPNIKSERTVAYEFGLEHRFTRDLGIDLTGFYKDVTNLVNMTEVVTANRGSFYYFTNADYANLKGLEFSLTQRYSHNFQAQLSYTLNWAIGKNWSTRQTFSDLWASITPRNRFYPMPWDQRHTFNLLASYRVPRDWGPPVGGQHLLGDWAVTILWRGGSGTRWSTFSRDINPPLNDRTLPFWHRTELYLEKNFSFGNWLQVGLFSRITNVFNQRSIRSIASGQWYDISADQTAAPGRRNLHIGTPGSLVQAGERDPEGTRAPNLGVYGAKRRMQIGLSLKF